jgi:hypothetical protein
MDRIAARKLTLPEAGAGSQVALRFEVDDGLMTKTKKLLGAAAFSLALAGGGAAGALLGTPSLSVAQEESDEPTTSDDSRRPWRHERGERLSVAAEALGISADELRAALEDGKTIAQVAEEQGVDIDTVIDALVTEVTENVRERITAMVNGEGPRPGHFRHHRGPAGGGEESAA